MKDRPFPVKEKHRYWRPEPLFWPLDEQRQGDQSGGLADLLHGAQNVAGLTADGTGAGVWLGGSL